MNKKRSRKRVKSQDKALQILLGQLDNLEKLEVCERIEQKEDLKINIECSSSNFGKEFMTKFRASSRPNDFSNLN